MNRKSKRGVVSRHRPLGASFCVSSDGIKLPSFFQTTCHGPSLLIGLPSHSWVNSEMLQKIQTAFYHISILVVSLLNCTGPLASCLLRTTNPENPGARGQPQRGPLLLYWVCFGSDQVPPQPFLRTVRGVPLLWQRLSWTLLVLLLPTGGSSPSPGRLQSVTNHVHVRP